jgi:hypothetical protein
MIEPKVVLLSYTKDLLETVTAAINQCYSPKTGQELKESRSKEKQQKLAPKMDLEEFKGKNNNIGSRNTKATQYAGKLLQGIKPEMWEAVGWEEFQKWNQTQNMPPLEEEELKSVWESIKKAEEIDYRWLFAWVESAAV